VASARINKKAEWGDTKKISLAEFDGGEFLKWVVTWTKKFDEGASPFFKGVGSGTEHFNAVSGKPIPPGERKVKVSVGIKHPSGGEIPPILPGNSSTVCGYKKMIVISHMHSNS